MYRILFYKIDSNNSPWASPNYDTITRCEDEALKILQEQCNKFRKKTLQSGELFSYFIIEDVETKQKLDYKVYFELLFNVEINNVGNNHA